MKKLMTSGFAVALVALLSACAAGVPVPTDQMAVARNAIDYAVEMGAREYAPSELEQARAHLAEAERAIDQEQNTIARQLAMEAEKIARLADLKARSARSNRQVQELEDTVEALREEIDRVSGDAR